MNRIELQQLSELRLADAESLLAASRWEAAYYLLGYCVECGLKACIAKQFQKHDVPPRKVIDSFYTHRLDQLIKTSRLQDQFESKYQSDRVFQDNWRIVEEWSEGVRYRIHIGEDVARDMFRAVSDQE